MLKNSSDEGNMIDNSEQTIHKQENTNFARISSFFLSERLFQNPPANGQSELSEDRKA